MCDFSLVGWTLDIQIVIIYVILEKTITKFKNIA